MIKIKWQNIEFYLRVGSSIEQYYIAHQFQSDIGNEIKYQYGYYEMIYQIMLQLRCFFDGVCLLETVVESAIDESFSYPLEIEMAGVGMVEVVIFCPTAESRSGVLCQYFMKKFPLALEDGRAHDDDSCNKNQPQLLIDDCDVLSYSLITGMTHLSYRELRELEVGDVVIMQEIMPFIKLGSRLYISLDIIPDDILTVKAINHHEE